MAETHRSRAPGGRRPGWVLIAVALILGLTAPACGDGDVARPHAIPTPTGLTTTPAHETPGDFGFVLRYGYGGFGRKNVLDTFAGTFTKDMIVDPPVTTELRLAPEDLADIYRRMVEIDIWDYPAVFRPPGNGGVEPYPSYYLKLKAGGRELTIDWEDRQLSPAAEATALRSLLGYIQRLVESREEYKKLPQPRGAYA